MFEIKKFVATLNFKDHIRELFFDMAEERGIESHWDVYHVLAGEETIPSNEVDIMSKIYDTAIKTDEILLKFYNSSIENFQVNLSKKNNEREGIR